MIAFFAFDLTHFVFMGTLYDDTWKS